ncbi:MAG: SDR family NAD(P)-dependent oxidoreductase [Acidimicrobiales bacterium]
MNDVTGMPQSAVVLGANSDIANAIVDRLASRRLRRAVLGARDPEMLDLAAGNLRHRGVEVMTAHFDVCEDAHRAFARQAAERLGCIDLLLVTAGALGDNTLDRLSGEDAAKLIATNFSGPAAAIIEFARVMRDQGFGRIVVLSSVAGVRVRRANFVYGSAKAGLDGFCQGLSDALSGTGVTVMIVRPGFVRTKMTERLRPAPFATSAGAVARRVLEGLERNARVVWVPRYLGVISMGLRWLPAPVWRRLPG